ncbi:MAG: hypothetical protein KBT20_01140 [Bacteroidales bacterium]|nr:hypothetical protein [Candidatus Liminaster caballi]
MKKIFSILAAALMLVPSAYAQKLLSVEETTEGIGIYPCGERHEAMVQFVTHESFGLDFDSNYDSELDIHLDSVAGTKTYSIVFVTQAPGVDYSGRRITIKAPGFKGYTLPLNLKDKQKFEYTVSDPYSALRSPYFVYQEKGNDLFYNAQYQGAKDCYEMIKACPEYQLNKESVDEHIAMCDSMVEWSAKALELEHFAKFSDATDMYYKMYRYNSSNEALRSRIAATRQMYLDDCEAEFTLAEHYMDINKVNEAKACYQRIIDKKCNNRIVEATAALANIERKQNKSKESARCLFYDFGPNQAIGLTFAQCYQSARRSSGYITVRTNASAFSMMSGKSSVNGTITGEWPTLSKIGTGNEELLRSAFDLESGTLKWKYDDDSYKSIYDESGDEALAADPSYYAPKDFDFEASMSFGWTVRIWRYFFAHLGVGYHGGGFYTFDRDAAARNIVKEYKSSKNTFDYTSDFNDWDDELRNKCMKTNWFNGVAPEAGLIVKVWHVNVKATYQYSYWLNDNGFKKFCEDNTGKLYFGVGFNW